MKTEVNIITVFYYVKLALLTFYEIFICSKNSYHKNGYQNTNQIII